MAMTIATRDAGPGHRMPVSVGRIGARARVFAAAQRHSRLVRLLRIVLPLAAGGVLAGYLLVAAASWVQNHSRFKVAAVTITADDLTMKNPSYFDFTSDGRYEVRARRAVVSFERNAPVKLIDVSGDLVQRNGTITNLQAKHGIYDKAKGELELFDGIEIDGSNGFMARLSRMTFYSRESKLVSEHPVSAATPTGSVQASAMTMNTKTRRTMFRGAVAVRLLASAQTVGIGADARKPVDVRAEELDVDDGQKTAHFRGKVVALQGETMLQAPHLVIKYEGKASAALDSAPPAAAGRDGTTRVTFLSARDGVEITAGNDRRIVSELADFDVAADTALFVGKVVATQDKNVLKGERLFVDRKAGRTRLETPGEGGRIAATFLQATAPGAVAPRPRPSRSAEAANETMFGSFKSDPTAPMEVEADALDIHEADGKAIFNGNVKAKQGELVMRTAELTAFFSGPAGLGLADAGAAGADTKSQKSEVVRLEAKRGVIFTSKDGQRAVAKWATFDIKANTALLGGGVTVVRGGDLAKQDVGRGDRLRIDLTTGTYRFESEGGPNRYPAWPPPSQPKGGASTSSSPPASSAVTGNKVDGCPPGRQCFLVYPKQVRDRAVDVLKKKAPGLDAR